MRSPHKHTHKALIGIALFVLLMTIGLAIPPVRQAASAGLKAISQQIEKKVPGAAKLFHGGATAASRSASAATALPAAALNNNETITASSMPATGSTVAAGSLITYVVEAKNGPSGGGADNNAAVKFNIPAGTSLVSVTSGGSDPFQCSAPAGPGATVTCADTATFQQNSNTTFVVVVEVNNPPAGNSVSFDAVYTDSDNCASGCSNGPKTTGAIAHNIVQPAGPPADLQIIKTADKASVIAGGGNPDGEIEYTLRVRNNGPNDANNVAVEDFVPPNTTLVSNPAWSGSPNGACTLRPDNSFFCRPSNSGNILPTGAQITIKYKVNVNAGVADGGIINNSALVSSWGPANSSPDPTPTNNFGLARTEVKAKADLKVEYDNGTGPNPICAGKTVDFIVKVTNNGPSDARNVVMSNLLYPQQQHLQNTFVSVSTIEAPGFACSTPSVGGTGTVSCTAATLPSGAQATIWVRVKVRPEFTGNVTYNRSLVSSTTQETAPDDNVADTSIDVAQCADVEVVSKIATAFPSGPQAVAGEKLAYDIVVRNNGPSDAYDVRLDDFIPAGTSFDSVSATGVFAGRCNDLVQCVPPDLPGLNPSITRTDVFPAGDTANIRLIVKINPGRMAPVVNTTTIYTTTDDANPINNSKNVTTPLIKKTDVTIKKTGPTTVTAGNTYTYTVVVRNDGPSNAPPNTVTVSDTLDNRLTYQSYFATGDGNFSCSNAGNAVSCTNTAELGNFSLNAGGFATITFVFKVKDDVQPNTIIANTATVSSPNDSNNGNNTSTTSTAGQTSADLQLAKTATAGPVTAGQGQITYTLNIRNSGPSNANGVTVNDNIPANTTLISGLVWAPGTGAPAGSCGVTNGAITCAPTAAGGVLKDGHTATITYTVAVPASALNGTLVTNQAVIASTGPNTTPDPNPSNNTQDPTTTLIATKADLAVDKTDSGAGLGPDPVLAGNTVTYRIRVNNNGPSDAQNVGVTDQLSADTVFESINAAGAPGFTCVTPAVGASGTVSCARGVVPPGAANYDILVTVRVRPEAAGSVSDIATVSSATNDMAGGNNTDTESTTVNTVADVELVSKTDSPDPVVAGENLTYTITFKNNGPSLAQGVTISDSIPANTTFVSVNPPVGYSCTVPAVGATGTVSCAPPGGTLDAGAIGEIKLTVKVAANPSSLTISNTATIATSSSQGNQGANAAPDSKTEQTAVVRETDLTVQKTGPAVATAGNTYTYTIVVFNNGPSDAPANSVTMTDTLDSNLTFLSASADSVFTCSNVSNAVTCANSAAALGANGKATITITFRVNNGVPANTIISNTARVSSPNDPNGANNLSTTSTAGATSADVQLTKTAAPGSVVAGMASPGGDITYTITVLNSGPSVANDVVLNDTVPANTVLVAQPAFVNTGTPAISMTCSAVAPGAQFTCSLPGAMPVGAAGTITYKVRVPGNIAAGTIVTNQAQIASTGANSTPDPNPANNSQVPTSTLVTTVANLGITKSGSPGTVKAGDNITYTINVTNNGPSDARNVVLTDAVPANTSFVSVAAPAGWSCAAPTLGGTGTLSCTTATLAAGAPAQTLTVIVKVNPSFTGSQVSNTATVSSTTPEPSPDPNANSATATTNVQTMSAVAVTKQITGLPPGSQPPTVSAGDYISYTITIANAGPSDGMLTAAGLSDSIPANTTFVSFSGTGILGGNACSFSNNTLTCLPNGIVPAGTTSTANFVNLVVRVNANAPVGPLTNTASANVLTTNQGISNPPFGSATVNVVRSVDLAITKKAPDFVRSGDTFSYTLTVTNNGPSEIPAGVGGVTVSDTLPGQVSYLGSSATGAGNFSGSFAAGVVTFSNTTAIQVGGVATLVINARVNPGVAVNTQITNTATVTENLADTTDPVADNNTAMAVSTTTTGADLQLSKTADRNSVESGGGAATGRITYSIKIANSGPSTANSVQVIDNIPAFANLVGAVSFTGTSFVPQTGPPAPAVPAGSCAVDAGGKITCNVTSNGGALLIGQGATISYTVEIPAGVPLGTIIANEATVASVGANATADPNPSNNTDSTNTVVSFGADLIVEKTANPADGGGVIAGQYIDYTLTIKNNGPSDAQNAVVIDTLSDAGSPNANSVRTTFVSLDASAAPDFTCSAPSVGGTGSITCSRAILPPTGAGPYPKIKIRVLVDPSAASGNVDNSVSISSSTVDPDTSNNSDSTQHPVSAFSTLALVKSAQPNPVVAGQNQTYTLSVTNNGSSDALNVVLTDKLPAYTSLVSFSGSGAFTAAGTCAFDNATDTLQCSPNAGPPYAAPSGTPPAGGTLPKGATGTITLVVKVDANIPTSTVGPNSFKVTSNTPGANGTSNAVTVGVIRRADLALTKTAPASAIAGDVIDYTLTIRNNGPSGVPPAVAVTDVLPPGTTFVSITQSGAPSFAACTTPAVGAGGTVSCATNTLLPAGAVETIIIKVRVGTSAQENTNIVNCATVTAPEPPEGDAGPIDPTPGNNKSCAATVVHTSADLGVSKTGSTSGTAGTPITYAINYGNAGPSDAAGVRITDPIPNNTALQTTTPFTVQANDSNPATPPINVVCRLISGQIICSPEGNGPAYADGVLPAGYTGGFQLVALVNPSVPGGTIITNQVNITSAPGGTTPATPDPNPGNNTAVATNTIVVAASQLSISKAIVAATFAQAPPAAAGAVVPGTQMTYRITVTNTGPSDVANIRVIDMIPANVKYVAINQSGGFGTTFTCQPPTGITDPSGNGGITQCTAPIMSATAPNNTATIDLTVFIDPSTKSSIANRADVNATTNGFNTPVSASFTLTTPVGPTSDLALTKTHTPEPVIAGNNLTYTLTLRNNGPSTAAMVNLVDDLPQFQSLTGPVDVSAAPGFSCTPNTAGTTGTITCTSAAMAPGAQVVLKMTVKVDPSAPAGTYNNVATATSMSFDPTLATVTDPVTVITRADLAITKTAPSTVVAGTQMTYTIDAVNNGPSSANNLMITDALPAGVVFIAASAPGSTALTTPAVSANGTVKATWAGLTLPGVVRRLTITVRVCSEVACDTNINNTAATSSDTIDPDTSNNSSTATTKALAQWDLSIVKNGPATATPDSTITYTLTVTNAGPSVATNAVVTDILPKGFTVVGTPAATILGAQVSVATNSVNGQQTVTANLGSVGADNQCSTNLPKVVTITIVVKVAKTMPFITVTNLASVASSANCTGGAQGDQNAANNSTSLITRIVNGGPEVGLAFPADSEVSDQKGGSVLIYPIYTSDAANPNRENTRITITNTHGMEKACVHLFGVDGATCAVADAYVCLTPNQTTSFLASDLDPGNRGYFIAVAVDCETGLPKAFNYLIGDEYVKFSSGHQANLAAESIAATMWNPAGADPNQRTVTLNFDGMSYNRLPTILSLDNVLSPADGNNTMLIVNRIGGDLSNSAATIGPLFGFVFNDQEIGYSFTATVGACQLKQTLSNSFPRLLTPFGNVIPAGRSGWMKFWSNNEYGLFGASINFNPNAAANSGSFNQGHNLHKLRLSPNATLTIPVVVPFC